MSQENGAVIRKHIDGAWEIVFEGQRAVIGKVIKSDDNWVTMCPCFDYVSTTNVSPQGAQCQRLAVPIELASSSVDVKVKIRATRRMRLEDFDREDQDLFEKTVANAFEVTRQVRAARSGVSIVSAMPKGLPKIG